MWGLVDSSLAASLIEEQGISNPDMEFLTEEKELLRKSKQFMMT